MTTRQVFVSRDVHFLKNIFPVKDLDAPSPHLPIPPYAVFLDTDPRNIVSFTTTTYSSDIDITENSQSSNADHISSPTDVTPKA